jgi:DNA-binding CsgD family transcriptional regulator/5-methylcytosine-specific restriction endonuclease McrA
VRPDATVEAPRLHSSTGDEVERLLTAGHTRAEIARRLDVSRATVTYHARRLGMPIDHRAARRYDWSAVQAYYDAGHTVLECAAHFGFSNATWSSAARRGDVVARPTAMPIEELLSRSRARKHLKGRLVKAGLLTERCAECGITRWREQPLSLELHHINGDGHDNRLENLTLLCPNCHSQTDSWGGRNSRRGAALRSERAARRARSRR